MSASTPIISPEQARDYLEQDAVNVAMKLKAGGTLTTAERAMMAKLAARSSSAAPVPTESPPRDESPHSSKSFTLETAAPLPARIRHAQPLSHYAKLYNRSERRVKEWVSRGRHSNPPDLPPLDDPPRMAAWWRRVIDKYPPDEMLAVESAEPADSKPETRNLATVNASASPDESSMTAMDLGSLELAEGEQVKQARSLVQATHLQLVAATEGKSPDAFRRWLPLWTDATEALRRLVKADAEEKKMRGEYVSRPSVLAEISQLMESLRIMRERMADKVIAQLARSDIPKLAEILPLITAPLRDAINEVRAVENSLFQSLETLRGPEELATLLDRAA